MNPFRLLSAFDLFSNTKALGEEISHDYSLTRKNSWRFEIDYPHSKYSAQEIRKLLNKQGIETWAALTGPFNRETGFTVSRQDAKRAEEILMKHGIPIK